MLNKTLTRLSLATPALIAASEVSAHPGRHMELNTSQVLNHMLVSPFHTGIIIAAVVAVAFIIRKVSHANNPE